MKIKTVIISVAVSAALVASGVYGAYYMIRSKKAPVEVVPLSNVNLGSFWGDNDSLYGNVTSQIAQTIILNEEYEVAEIFVKAGDKVKKGTPLFSYDMTLPELELEMEQLTLQTHELSLAKLQKDLEKLKKTPATASLTLDEFVMTTSSDDKIPEAEILNEADSGGAPENHEPGDSLQLPGDGKEKAESGQTESLGNGSGVSIEEIETVKEGTEDQERRSVLESVAGFEGLVEAIDSLFQAYGEELQAQEVTEALKDAVTYYQKHLAEKKTVSVQAEDGTEKEKQMYVIRDSVKKILGDSETEKLVKYYEKLELCLVQCIQLMLEEAVGQETEELRQTYAEILVFYEALTAENQNKIEDQEEISALAERLSTEQAVSDTTKSDANELNTGESEMDKNQGGTDNGESETAGSQGEPDTDAGQGGTDNGESETADSQGGTDNGESETAGDQGGSDKNEGESEAGKDEGTEQETEPESSATPGETQPGQSETTEETETEIQETEPQQSYEIEVQAPGIANVSAAVPGTLVVIHTDTDIPGVAFVGWTVYSDGKEVDAADLENFQPANTDTSFLMPQYSLKLVPNYQIVPSELEGFLSVFEELAAAALAEDASQQPDYRNMLGNAVDYYQQWLAEVSDEILSTAGTLPKMEEHQLKEVVKEYLTEQNRDTDIEKLSDSYKKICKKYVKEMVTALDAYNLTRADLTAAWDAYEKLGDGWMAELEQEWLDEQMAQLEEQTQEQSEEQTKEQEEDLEEEPESGQEPVLSVLTLKELLEAYDMILTIQELDAGQTEEMFQVMLSKAKEKYLALSDAQKQIVWNASILIDALKQYGMWEDETEEPIGDGDDYSGFGDEYGYTASELAELIEETEREIREYELSIRETELSVKQYQQIVDGKVVKSTLDGIVVSIGTADGNSDDEYFAKVTNAEGLYATGRMNELSLGTIKVGDKISGMMTNSGVSFTATITEISSYPSLDSDGMYYSYGTENTNASYYLFYARLDDTTDIEEGEAELQLSETMTSSEDAVYLERYFVRTDNTGKSYVYIQGEDDKLKKQYVTTGKLMYGYALEIISGLKKSDQIAFPYGNDVVEGADTKEVDILSAYM